MRKRNYSSEVTTISVRSPIWPYHGLSSCRTHFWISNVCVGRRGLDVYDSFTNRLSRDKRGTIQRSIYPGTRPTFGPRKPHHSHEWSCLQERSHRKNRSSQIDESALELPRKREREKESVGEPSGSFFPRLSPVLYHLSGYESKMTGAPFCSRHRPTLLRTMVRAEVQISHVPGRRNRANVLTRVGNTTKVMIGAYQNSIDLNP